MGKTVLSIKGDRFYINGELTYSEIEGCRHKGLLMNARFIQGVYDDRAGREKYQRFGRTFDPETNTDRLIVALPGWYSAGLRAFTVGLQGGGNCFTIASDSIDNNPYSPDGRTVDKRYLGRLDRLIRASDELGMVVIVSCFYAGQCRHFDSDVAVVEAVRTVSRWLREQQYTNVIIELANEYDFRDWAIPIMPSDRNVVRLMEIAREESGGMPVGCSGSGGFYSETVAAASDVILIHGNEQTRNRIYNMIKLARKVKPVRPIVFNEDSAAISQLGVTFAEDVSWGYYNNMTKQEVPADWGITAGEDAFFALRMKLGLGITDELPAVEDQYYIQGLEPDMEYNGQRYVRLASLFPEKTDFVEFYRNGELIDRAYDDPFMVNFMGNWRQGGISVAGGREEWKAVIHLHDGSIIEKTAEI